MWVAAAVAGTLEDGVGDGAGSTTNEPGISLEAAADKLKEVRKGAPKLQGDGKERSDGPGFGELRRGEKLPIPGSIPARFDPIPR